jgi:hypothetical protein
MVPLMTGQLSHSLANLRRQFRLLRRHLRYGPPGWPISDKSAYAAALATLFRGVNQHLLTLGGDYWIVYGTLLGWHREGRILPHDYDVDFGAPVARYREILNSAHLLPEGFTLHDTSHRHHGPKLYIEYHGWEADIYFYTEKDHHLRSTEKSLNPGDTIPFPREYFYPPTPARLLGQPTFVPAQPVAYLEHIYRYLGPDAIRDPVTRYFRPRA